MQRIPYGTGLYPAPALPIPLPVCGLGKAIDDGPNVLTHITHMEDLE